MTFRSGLGTGGLHRAVHDPNLWLEGALRDGVKANQKHIIKVHEPLTNLPLVGGWAPHGV